jgi:hypothetical protein
MTPRNVAVVGAGIAGIVAARTLVEKGHRAVVFEKEAELGGKCASHTYQGQVYEMGACSVSPEFDTVLHFARRTAALLKRRYPFWVMHEDGRRVSFREEYWPLAATPRLLAQVARYLYHATRFSLFYDHPTTYPCVPEEYRDSFLKFCTENRMPDVARWMELPVVSFGYGDLDTIKTWYVLDYVTPVNFLGLAVLLILFGQSPVHQFQEGFGDLVRRIATLEPRLDVRLSTPISQIRRTRTGVFLTTPSGQEGPFDDVVLAVPLNDLKGCLDLSAEEQALLGQLKTNVYGIAACALENMPHDNHLLRFNACHQNFGHVALLERGLHGAASKLTVCYVPIMDRLNLRANGGADVVKYLRSDLAKLKITLQQVIEYRDWEYFSHFEDADAYKTLDALQGQNRTYYVGGMCKFELAERSAQVARGVIDRGFDGRLPRDWLAKLRNYWHFYARSVPPDA